MVEVASATLFPVFLKLAGRKVLVVGGGSVALEKIRQLRAAHARVSVVAPVVAPALNADGITLQKRPFEEGDLDGVWFVIAAATPEVNRAVVAAAEQRRIFVNAVDDREAASAYLGGVLRRGGVTVAVSTEGAAPALAGLLREALEEVLPEELAAWVEIARRERVSWMARGLPHARRRPLLLAALNQLYAQRSEVSS